ncbi:MAG: efflux RND transporter periplasmic adaptor subunit [Litorimonas sp.]
MIRLMSGLLALSLLTACNDKTAPKEAPSERLQVQNVETGEVTRVINASGTVQPETTVLVGSEVSGRVLSVGVDFNTPVNAGDALAVIDPQTFQNQVLQLEASQLRDEATIKTSESGIIRAEVNLRQNQQILERRKDLYEQNATSLAQLEEAERSVGVSDADLAVSRAQLEGAKASLAQTRASLRTARFNLSRTIIQSPIDGIVIERQIDPGQTVQASFSAPELFKIAADLSEIVVEAAIVESDVGGLGEGDAVEFTVDAYPATPFRGVIKQLRLNSELKNNIVTYVAIVKAQNSEGLLLPGMTANLQITTDTKPGVLRVSADAERFRPTPEQLETWLSDSQKKTQQVSLNEPVYTRLSKIGVSEALIASIRTELDSSSAQVRKTINDPTKVFQRTRSLQQLVNLTNLILSNNLDQRDMQAYNSLLAQENSVRSTKLWVRREDGKMESRPVKLGLTDGTFVEIVSGLDKGDKVVINIGAARGNARGQRGGREGGQRPAGGGRRGGR